MRVDWLGSGHWGRVGRGLGEPIVEIPSIAEATIYGLCCAVRFKKLSLPLIVGLLVSGCSSISGQVDLVTAPKHEWQIGSWTLLVYPSETLLRIGGTYYVLHISFYLLICGLVALVVFGAVARAFYRRSRHGNAG